MTTEATEKLTGQTRKNEVNFIAQLSACAGALASGVKLDTDASGAQHLLADMLLEVLGIKLNCEFTQPEANAEEQQPDAPDDSGVSPLAQHEDGYPIMPAAATISWPPRKPSLPEVYTENYYVVREGGVVALGEPVIMQAIGPATFESVAIIGGTQLMFVGESAWDSGSECWRMRMHAVGEKKLFWVSSKDLKPGDEIPKDTP